LATLQSAFSDYFKQYGPLKVTYVIHTLPGVLSKIKHVLHVVGPQAKDFLDKNKMAELFETAFLNVLQYADELGLQSFAVPAISAGIFWN
jgi:O-acetyl-ADP-ribose deacetylase (regulator of RNase III)